MHIPENTKMKRKVNVSIASVLALVAIAVLSAQPVSASMDKAVACPQSMYHMLSGTLCMLR